MTNDRFRKQLEIDFMDAYGEPIFETIEELKILMRRKGYRTPFNKQLRQTVNQNPTQKQLDVAYFHLTKKAQRVIEEFYTVEIYVKRKVHRATRNTFIGGKLYRKGQFIPTQK